MSALTIPEIMDKAPAVFQDYPAVTVADKYKLIKTSDLIEPMSDYGWNVVDVQQRRTRKEQWQDKTYHFIRLRNSNYRIGEDNIDIIISNSHNATAAFKIQMGMYRLVCSNGLTVGTDLVSPLTLQHRGLSQSFIAELSQLYINKMTDSVDDATHYMKIIDLNDEKQEEFAKRASLLKHDAQYEVDINGLLLPKRREDYKADIWTIYNVIQENLMLGSYRIKGKDGWRNARRVSSPASNIEINTKLFNIAMEYAA